MFIWRHRELSLKSVKKISANRCELEVEVNKSEFEKGLNSAYRKTAKKYSVPGFRKGHAPRSFIEKRYGEGIFYEEAFNILCPEFLDAAVKEAKLDTVPDKIDLGLENIGKDGFTFRATLTVKPEAEISGYKGLKVKPFTKEVTSKDVEERLSRIQKENAKLVAVENRPCRKGDTVVIDFVGKVNDKVFKGGSADNYSLKLGSGQTIDGFEDSIIGHNTGDVFDFTVTFPENYGKAKLRGKDAVFTMTLHEIKEPQLSPLTDDFVKEISSSSSVDEFKKEVKKKLEEELKGEKEEDLNLQIIDSVCNLLKADIPEAMYKNRANENLKNLRAECMAHHISLDEFLEFTKVSPETKKDKCRELAEQQVKLGLALETIAKKENLNPSEERIEEEYKKLAKVYRVSEDKVRENVKREALMHDLSCLMAFDFLKENCVVEGAM